ncbi:hypothetical protein JM654_15505 [Microbacterium oxydans]|nr:hypothetical protein [Microbacterium oxydans]
MSHRSAETPPPEPPVSLPLASIRVDARGAMRVIYDDHEFPPPSPGSAWSRSQFGELLDALSDHRARTVRVEVREHDGSVFTDIVHAKRHERIDGASGMRRARHRPPHQLVEVRGSGFIPGEDLTVALSVSSTEGAADGSARAVVDLSHLVEHGSEILLIGRISGVIASECLPS